MSGFGVPGTDSAVGPSDHSRLRNLTRDDAHPQYALRTSVITVLPPGALLDYAGSTAPTGFLLCDGSDVSRTDYADLFAVIGETFGPGDGSTTFTLPDFQDRTAIGKSGTKALGDTGGSADAIVVSHAHSHNHGSHSHTQNSHNHTQDAHNHDLPEGRDGTLTNPSSFIKMGWSDNSGTATGNTGGTGARTATNQAATATNQSTTPTTDATSAGSSGTNANLPPFLAVNKIIKT